MVPYTLEQRWIVGLRSIYRRCRFWQKKILFSDAAHFDHGGYVNKQKKKKEIWENIQQIFFKSIFQKKGIWRTLYMPYKIFIGYWNIILCIIRNIELRFVKLNS